jgi:hypothetical protein
VLFVAATWSLGLVGTWSAVASTLDEAKLTFFEQRIRPVLVEHCYECHSAESKSLKGGLRLDSRAGLLRGGDTRAAVVPGDARGSLLVAAVGYGNHDLQMPPQGRLPAAVVADLTRWVDEGAMAPEGRGLEPKSWRATQDSSAHWAFQAPGEIKPPPSADPALPSDKALDRFVWARLAEKGLTLAPTADRRTLIRRATYDLIGLPPTPEELKGFIEDPAPDAFERLIERLLASPRYGERWGRWWLDVARYADTNGQDENKVMANAWRYRDWVIRSFNANQPFNAFITEQLAGDLLPTNGVSEAVLFDRWTATGLLVLGPKMLAEQDKPKLVMDLVDEQIEVVSRAFLGLTVGCARCHDHKFDPVTARDYYALAGIFRSTKTMANLEFVSKFNERRIANGAELAAIEAHAQAVAVSNRAVEQAIQRGNSALSEEWRTNLVAYLTTASTADQREAMSGSLIPLRVTRLRELLAPDPATNAVSRTLRQLAGDPAKLSGFLETTESPSGENALRLAPGKVGAAFWADGRNYLEVPSSVALEPAHLTVELWVRASEFPREGDTRRWLVAKNANEWTEGHYALLLDRDRAGAYLNLGGGKGNLFALWSDQALKPDQWHHLALTYDGVWLRLFVDGKSTGETEINRARGAGPGPLALGRRPDGYVNFKGLLDEARVWSRALTPAEVKARCADVRSNDEASIVMRWDFNEVSAADQAALAVAEMRGALFGPGGVFSLPKEPRSLYPAATRAALEALEQARAELQAQAPAPAKFTLAVEDDSPIDLPVHIRGSHLNLAKEPVQRGFIQAVRSGKPSRLPQHQSGRLELADWLTQPDHPLTARVVVNRIWQAHFGEGLVRTPDNFGLRGETPSHPELLDWLAVEFIRSGWDVKQLHRLILGSATWQQAGAGDQQPQSGGGELAARAERGLLKSESGARAAQADPENRLLWHFPRQRLEAEMVRDALLAVSGRLDAAAGGSLVQWKNDDYTPKDDVSAASVRRSVYLPIVRDRVFDVFTIFDFANPSVGTAKRTPTVVSHQALFFLNSPLVKDSARAFAETLLATWPHDPLARIKLAYERAWGRLPTATESERAMRFVASVTRSSEPAAAWAAWCQTLFAANEFLYRE